MAAEGATRGQGVLGRGNGTQTGDCDCDWELALETATTTREPPSPLSPLPYTLSLPAPLKLVAHTVERHVNINVCRHNKTDWKRIAKLPATADAVLFPDSDFDKHLVTISELAMLWQNDFALCAEEREREREGGRGIEGRCTSLSHTSQTPRNVGRLASKWTGK